MPVWIPHALATQWNPLFQHLSLILETAGWATWRQNALKPLKPLGNKFFYWFKGLVQVLLEIA
ncbi:MAG: hypothetical protein CL676_09380 [Bdellovibrionaceae bacterium]|nr:hypothetical protein [Pseudobdellovibrionaceae bacterium]